MDSSLKNSAQQLAEAIRNQLLKPVYTGIIAQVDRQSEDTRRTIQLEVDGLTSQLTRVETLLQKLVDDQGAWQRALAGLRWDDDVGGSGL